MADPAALATQAALFHQACEQFHDNATRTAAEAALMQFRGHPLAKHVAMHVLASPAATVVDGGSVTPAPFPSNTRFQALNVLRDVLLRGWESVSLGDRAAVRLGLCKLAVDARFLGSSEPFVVRQLLQLIAVVYKRGWFDAVLAAGGEFGAGAGAAGATVADKPEVHGRSSLQPELLQRAQQFLDSGTAGGTMQTRLLGAELMGMVVDEFATSHSVAIGLSVAFHRRCCLDFSLGGCLLALCSLAARALAQATAEAAAVAAAPAAAAAAAPAAAPGGGAAATADADRQKLVVCLLKVISAGLGWDFEMKHGRFDSHGRSGSGDGSGDVSDDYHLKMAIARPPADWRPFLCSQRLVELLLPLAARRLGPSDRSGHTQRAAHLARQCLVQLASVDGPVFGEAAASLAARRQHVELVVVRSMALQDASPLPYFQPPLPRFITGCILLRPPSLHSPRPPSAHSSLCSSSSHLVRRRTLLPSSVARQAIFRALAKSCRVSSASPPSSSAGAGFVDPFDETATVDVCTVVQRLSLVHPFDAVLASVPAVLDFLLDAVAQLLQELLQVKSEKGGAPRTTLEKDNDNACKSQLAYLGPYATSHCGVHSVMTITTPRAATTATLSCAWTHPLRASFQAALASAAASSFDTDTAASWHMEAVDLLLDAWCKWSRCLLDAALRSGGSSASSASPSSSSSSWQPADPAAIFQLQQRVAPVAQRVFKVLCASRVQVAGLVAKANARELFRGEDLAAATQAPSLPSPGSSGGHHVVDDDDDDDNDGQGDEAVDEDDDDDPLTGFSRFSSEDASVVLGQLQSMAFIGRLHVAANLELLTSALQQKASVVLNEHRVALLGSAAPAAPAPALLQASEELRWLMLLLGFLVADDCDGELPLVPDVVNEASCRAQHGVKDHVVEVAKTVVMLLRSATDIWRARLASLAARSALPCPTLVLPHEPALLWLSLRWGATYIMCDPQDYGPRSYAPRRSPLSPGLAAACSVTSPQAPQLLELVVDCAAAAAAVAVPVVSALRNLNTLLFERSVLLLRGLLQRPSCHRLARGNKLRAWARLTNALTAQEPTSALAGADAVVATLVAFEHQRFQALPGLPLRYHREWVQAVCAPEAPVLVHAVATFLRTAVLGAVERLVAGATGGPAAVLAATGGMHARLQQLRGLVLAVEDVQSRGGTKVSSQTGRSVGGRGLGVRQRTGAVEALQAA
jgi:hypothetical protein